MEETTLIIGFFWDKAWKTQKMLSPKNLKTPVRAEPTALKDLFQRFAGFLLATLPLLNDSHWNFVFPFNVWSEDPTKTRIHSRLTDPYLPWYRLFCWLVIQVWNGFMPPAARSANWPGRRSLSWERQMEPWEQARSRKKSWVNEMKAPDSNFHSPNWRSLLGQLTTTQKSNSKIFLDTSLAILKH